MTQCIVELLEIFEALEELLFSLQCLSLLVWVFFPMVKYITPKGNHFWKQESPIKSHKLLSLAVTWAGVFGSCICSVVWSREVFPHHGLERTKQPTSDFQTLNICKFSWTDTLALSRKNGSWMLSNCASDSNISLFMSHDVYPFLCCFLSLRLFELPWILILILKVGFLMFFSFETVSEESLEWLIDV